MGGGKYFMVNLQADCAMHIKRS